MLVLTRKDGETIEIGRAITIKVISIKGKQVRIGIDAPESLKIKRGELEDLDCPKSHKKPH